MEELISVARISLPTGPLGKIEAARRKLNGVFPLSTSVAGRGGYAGQIDFPVRVRKTKKGVEVVGHFNSFHQALANLSAEGLVKVEWATDPVRILVEQALDDILILPDDIDLAEINLRNRIYRILTNLARSLRRECDLTLTGKISPKRLRQVLNLTPNQARLRRSGLSSYAAQMSFKKDE